MRDPYSALGPSRRCQQRSPVLTRVLLAFNLRQMCTKGHLRWPQERGANMRRLNWSAKSIEIKLPSRSNIRIGHLHKSISRALQRIPPGRCLLGMGVATTASRASGRRWVRISPLACRVPLFRLVDGTVKALSPGLLRAPAKT